MHTTRKQDAILDQTVQHELCAYFTVSEEVTSCCDLLKSLYILLKDMHCVYMCKMQLYMSHVNVNIDKGKQL